MTVQAKQVKTERSEPKSRNNVFGGMV